MCHKIIFNTIRILQFPLARVTIKYYSRFYSYPIKSNVTRFSRFKQVRTIIRNIIWSANKLHISMGSVVNGLSCINYVPQ